MARFRNRTRFEQISSELVRYSFQRSCLRTMTTVRMDLWLWAARFFKTRTLAKHACELGRIQSNGQVAKAARDVRIGDMLRISNEGGDFEVEVLLLNETRGPAVVAQTM